VRFDNDPADGSPFKKFGWHPAAFRSLCRFRLSAPARAASTGAPCHLRVQLVEATTKRDELPSIRMLRFDGSSLDGWNPAIAHT